MVRDSLQGVMVLKMICGLKELDDKEISKH